MTWAPYATVYPGEDHTTSGQIMVRRALYSPQLDNHRDVLVYLPPAYEQGESYPVIYMHDGQNLFDAATSFSGEWRVDKTLDALAAEGLKALVVGLPNVEAQQPGSRLREYTPFANQGLDTPDPQGDAYLAFLCETVKPLVDAGFRTLTDRDHTLIAGSSMGGLISLYALLARPESFGAAGVFSPAFWFTDDDAIFRYVQQQPGPAGKVYMDMGTNEVSMRDADPAHDAPPFYIAPNRYLNDARRMRDLLVAKRWQVGVDLLYVEEEGAIHHETAWARRLPDALRFLLR